MGSVRTGDLHFNSCSEYNPGWQGEKEALNIADTLTERGRMRTIPGSVSLIVICSHLVLFALVPAVSQGADISSGGSGGAERIDGKFKFLPIPYLNYDRSIGFQLGALPLAMFNPVQSDTISPSSLTGLFGMYTTNDTWFLMGFGRLHLDRDNWRITLAGGSGSVNFQFFMDSPVDGWIPYNTAMDLAFVQVQRRIVDRLYGGLSYIYLDFTTTLEPIPDQFHTTLHGLGLNLALDTRSSVYYPRSGYETSANYFTYPAAFGNEFASDKIELDYNHFVGMRRDLDVLAGRFFAGLGLGDLSFNQQFIVGRRSDIRGYTQGEYRGNYMLALQGEYRWNFRPRWGAVGFLGVATVLEAINEDNNGKLLPGIGTGFRFTVDRETNMNVGLDIAVGLDDWGIYFRLGEAF
jgi:hypothetical protein